MKDVANYISDLKKRFKLQPDINIKFKSPPQLSSQQSKGIQQMMVREDKLYLLNIIILCAVIRRRVQNIKTRTLKRDNDYVL